jgi:soluble lytic murein transglycosylase-like protein
MPESAAMVRLTYLSGKHQGTQLQLDLPTIRIGRAADCDVRFDAERDTTISIHHAEIVGQDDGHLLVDRGSTNGTSVNGLRISKQRLKAGDVLLFGGADGVTLRVDSLSPQRRSPARPPDPEPATLFVERPAPTPMVTPAAAAGRRIDTSAALVASVAAEKVVAARAKVGGQSSGETMNIMTAALAEVQQVTRVRSGRRWLKVVAAVGVVGLLVAGGLGLVVWRQRKEIEALVEKKGALDREIAAVMTAMEKERDEGRLADLEQRLGQLTGTAKRTVDELTKQDRDRAEALDGDELDRAIRRILAKFDAQTYAVPPVFKETLQHEVDVLAKASNLRFVYQRRNRYWPAIQAAFSRLGLPEEMAYIAWAETQFDPSRVSPAGARGMWQMTAPTARELGLRVDDKVDERLDVDKQTWAAARKLALLLSVFGSDSFMLAMASYNGGEAGVRRVLHVVAQEKDGFRKEKRDFWHLYRLRRLPQETMDYVPRVLAAAVVCGDPKKYGLEPPDPR